jgi:hypothetical protein
MRPTPLASKSKTASQKPAHKDWDLRPCPSCGEKRNFDLETSSSRPAETMPFDEVREYFIGIRKEQVFFSYYRCRTCLLLFCPYYFNATQVDSLYAEMPDNLLGAEKSVAEKTQNGYFSWIKGNIRKNIDSYLELGPDIGLITADVVREMNPKSLILVEPNILMHEQLMGLGTSKNIIKVSRNLANIEFENVDLTIGIHVFDHLIDPFEQLDSICKRTTNGGYIGIVVHDESSVLRRILGKKWPPFCLQHPQLYSQDTLENMLKKASFKKIKISKSINHFSMRHLGVLLVGILGAPKNIARVLPNVEIPILLGNQIGVFRKHEGIQ